MLAGVRSGAGKTTLACALLAALRRRGLRAAPFKAGPDYIDPTYLTRAAGVPCRNLDTWLVLPAVVRQLFARATVAADVAVVEGVMGLYDGRAAGLDGEGEDEGSTAHLAKLLDAPVVVVADAGGAARTVAAVILGLQHFDPAVRLAGVLLGGIGSPRHLELVGGPIRRATGLPVLGYLPRRPELALPGRHLGLVPAGEQGVDEAFFERLAAQAEETLDVDALLAIAQGAPPLHVSETPLVFPTVAATSPALAVPASSDGPRTRIALALDDAFHFYYEDGLDLLRAHGAELVPFSPLADETLPPDVGGVYLGGGFPEVFAAQLSTNEPMAAAVRGAALAGLPVYAECGGLMYLGAGLVDRDGVHHQMAGVFPYWSDMRQPRVTLGYRVATVRRDAVFLFQGQTLRGHEFHWSVLDRPPPADSAAYDLRSAAGEPVGHEGFVGGPAANVLASYVHCHFAADPALAPAFVNACRAAPSP